MGRGSLLYIAGRMGSGRYDAMDPRARLSEYDDRRFAVDHFKTKLFKHVDGFNTEKGGG